MVALLCRAMKLRKRLLRLLSLKKPKRTRAYLRDGLLLCKTDCHGVTLEYPPDDWMFKHIPFGHDYEPHALPVFLGLLTPDDVVVDVGANIGFYAVPAAKRAKRVICVEPGQDNVRLLVRNLHANGAFNFEVYPVAASDAVRAEWLEDHVHRNKAVRPAKTPNCLPVMALPLDLMLRNEHPTFIKFDIEGREPAALMGARETIRKHRPRISIEFSPAYYADGCGGQFPCAATQLLDAGYRPTVMRWDKTLQEAATHEAIDSIFAEAKEAGQTHLDIIFQP